MATQAPVAPAPAAPAPAAPAPSAAPQQSQAPQVRSADEFFGGALDAPHDGPEPEPEPIDDGTGQQQAATPPTDPLDALLQIASPEQREQAKKAIDALRSTQGRAKAEAQQRRESDAVAQRNYEAGQAWQRMFSAVLARARAQGLDVSDLEQMAGAGVGAGAAQPGQQVDGMSQDDFAEAASSLFDQHLGEKSEWLTGYNETLGQIDNLIRMARQAREAGDEQSALQFSQQARGLNIKLQRATAEASARPVLSLVYALGRQLAEMRGESRATQTQASEMQEAGAVWREAIKAHSLAKLDDGVTLKYPGFYEPGTSKPTEAGRDLAEAIGQWCWNHDQDPRDPDVWDTAYHDVIRRNPKLAATTPNGSAGARTPGGDASLGGGVAIPGPGANGGRSPLMSAPGEDIRQRRNVGSFGQRT